MMSQKGKRKLLIRTRRVLVKVSVSMPNRWGCPCHIMTIPSFWRANQKSDGDPVVATPCRPPPGYAILVPIAPAFRS